MKNCEVIEHLNFEDFHTRSQDCRNIGSRFFKVKLIKDRISQNYEGTVLFEIIGEIVDSEIENAITEKLDPIYRYVDLYQIFEV